MKFEEFIVGSSFISEPVEITEIEIFEFAERYDPQYLHLDKNAAEMGPFRNIIASGYHTLLAVWPNIIKLGIFENDVLGGVGIEHLRWKKPVFPDDHLTGTLTIIGKKETSAIDRGLVSFNLSIKNQNGDEVLVMESNGLFKKNLKG